MTALGCSWRWRMAVVLGMLGLGCSSKPEPVERLGEISSPIVAAASIAVKVTAITPGFEPPQPREQVGIQLIGFTAPPPPTGEDPGLRTLGDCNPSCDPLLIGLGAWKKVATYNPASPGIITLVGQAIIRPVTNSQPAPPTFQRCFHIGVDPVTGVPVPVPPDFSTCPPGTVHEGFNLVSCTGHSCTVKIEINPAESNPWRFTFDVGATCSPIGPDNTCDGVDDDCNGVADDLPGTCPPPQTGPSWVPIGPSPTAKGIGGNFAVGAADPAGGRATVMAVNPKNPYNVWLGTAGGGVWVTGDARIGGQSKAFAPGDLFDPTWVPMFIPFPTRLDSQAVGSIVLDESTCTSAGCSVVYVGTGEDHIRRDTYYGDGVYRLNFVAATQSWSATRLDETSQFRFGSVAKMLLDQGELFVALHAGNTTTATHASTRAPEPAAQYGVHRRNVNGTWTPLLVTDATGTENWPGFRIPTDIEKHPTQANTFYVGVMNDGIYRTTDRGATFCAMNPGAVLPGVSATDNITACSTGTGLPAAGSFDHVQLDVAPGQAQVFALFGNCPSGFTEPTRGVISVCDTMLPNPVTGTLEQAPRVPFLFSSADGGATYAPYTPPYSSFNLDTSTNPPTATAEGAASHYSRYTNAMTRSGSTLLYGGVNLHAITATTANKFLTVAVHPDFHQLVIPDVRAPIVAGNTNDIVVYAANDGGFYFLNTATKTWTGGNSMLNATEFYGIGIDQLPEPANTGTRSLGILGGLQDNGVVAFNGGRTWEVWRGGDGGEAVVQSPLVSYNSVYENSIERSGGVDASGFRPGNLLQWKATLHDIAFSVPFVQHEATKRLYVGTEVVSVRAGDDASWAATMPPAAEPISPLLGTVGAGFPAVETARNLITSLAVADSDEWQIYVGTYDGHLFRSVGGRKPTAVAADWPDATGNLPPGVVSSIAVNPTSSSDVWVTLSDFTSNSKVWHSTTGGTTWAASGPPVTAKVEPAKVIKIDPRDAQRLWLGTDQGVWVSPNAGGTWERRSANLPNVPVFDIEIDRFTNRVFAATHGRGVWMLPETGPVLTSFLGCTASGKFDGLPVYGNGFTCAQSGGCTCTIDVLREDGTVCAHSPDSKDAQGHLVSVPFNGTELTTAEGGTCSNCQGRPVAWACFDGTCVGNTPVSACTAGGHFLSGVTVNCLTNPLATGAAAGSCPDVADPPSMIFTVDPQLSNAPPPPTTPVAQSIILAPTLPAAPANGGDKVLCLAEMKFQSSWVSQDIQIAAREAINLNPTCVQAGVKAVLQGTNMGSGEDAAPEYRLVLRAAGLKGNRLALSLAVRPGEADRVCLTQSQLAPLLAGQLGPVSFGFQTASSGAAGGSVVLEERSPVGTCGMSVRTQAGQNATSVATALVSAFNAPGTPSPSTCAENQNSRDLVQQGAVVRSSLANGLTVCLQDHGLGLTIAPPGVQLPVIDARFQDLALLASDTLTLGDRADVYEPTGLGAPVAGGFLANTLKYDAKVGDYYSQGPVTLFERSHVRGVLVTGSTATPRPTSVVDKGTFQGAPLRLPDIRRFAVGFPTTNLGNVPLGSGQTLTKAPGSYATVSLATNATLRLSTGNYFMRSLTLEPGSRLLLDQASGPVFIYVRDALVFRGAIVSVTGAAPNLLLDYLGTGTGIIERSFSGALVAPNARLLFSSSSPQIHHGSFFARFLQFEPDQSVEHIAFNFDLTLGAPAAACNDSMRNGLEGDVDCGGSCATKCVAGRTCATNGDCTSNQCTGGICQGPAATCTEAIAVDMGAPGADVVVPNSGCVRVRDGYPSWWGTRSMQLQTATAAGAYPVPFSWSSSCANGSGSDTLTTTGQTRVFGPTNLACATLIDLKGAGQGFVTLHYNSN